MHRLIDEYNNSNSQRGLLNTESRNAYLREAEMRNKLNRRAFLAPFHGIIRQRHRPGRKIGLLCLVRRAAHDPGWYKQSKLKRYVT